MAKAPNPFVHFLGNMDSERTYFTWKSIKAQQTMNTYMNQTISGICRIRIELGKTVQISCLTH